MNLPTILRYFSLVIAAAVVKARGESCQKVTLYEDSVKCDGQSHIVYHEIGTADEHDCGALSMKQEFEFVCKPAPSYF